MSRMEQARLLLDNLRASYEAVNSFVDLNAAAIREVTGMEVNAPSASGSIYTTSSAHALILQIYADALARNLDEPEPSKLPA